MEQSGTKGLRLQRAVNLLLTIRSACTATPFTSAFTGFNIPWKSGGMKYEYKCLSFISWGYPLERALPFLYLENQQRAPDRNSKWAGLVPCLMADLGQDQQNKSWCTATTPVWRAARYLTWSYKSCCPMPDNEWGNAFCNVSKELCH